MSNAPRPWHCALVYLVAMGTQLFTVLVAILPMGLLPASILAQVLGFGLIPVMAMVAFGYKPADIGLVAPAPAVWQMTLPMGFLAWLAAMPLAVWGDSLFPLNEEFAAMMEGIILHPSLALTLTAAAVAPAIFEEFLFRGFLLGSMRKWSLPGAIAISSLLFAVTHGAPAMFLFTLALGVLLCLLVVRTGSIWPGSAIHFIFNTTTILLTRSAASAPEGAPNAAAKVMTQMEGLTVLNGGLLLAVAVVATHQLLKMVPARPQKPA